MLCLLCYLPTKKSGEFCYQCSKNLPYIGTACYKCGQPLASQSIACAFCQQHPPQWDYLIAVTDYIPPLSKLIHQLKFQKKIILANALAKLMMQTYLNARRVQLFNKPDVITCIPIHRLRYWSRGYNQSALLAKPIAKWMGKPFLPYLLQQNRAKRPQMGLNKKERQHNIQGIFSCHENLSGKSIAIIDDVITTGSTMNEACKVLRKQGAIDIQVICLCRTIL